MNTKSTIKSIGILGIIMAGLVFLLFLVWDQLGQESTAYHGVAVVKDLYHEAQRYESYAVYMGKDQSTTQIISVPETWRVVVAISDRTYTIEIDGESWYELRIGSEVHVYERRGAFFSHGFYLRRTKERLVGASFLI